MRITTALNHEKRLNGRMRDIYYFARTCGYSHTKILKRRQELFNDPAWVRVPQWVRNHVYHTGEMLSSQLYMIVAHPSVLQRALAQSENLPYLRWQLRVDGKHVSSEEVCSLRAAGDEDIWNRTEGAHIWNHLPDNAFSPWDSINTTRRITP